MSWDSSPVETIDPLVQFIVSFQPEEADSMSEVVHMTKNIQEMVLLVET